MHIEIPQELVEARRDSGQRLHDTDPPRAALDAAQILAEGAYARVRKAEAAFRAEFCRRVQELVGPPEVK